jgi:hypothetical protein
MLYLNSRSPGLRYFTVFREDSQAISPLTQAFPVDTDQDMHIVEAFSIASMQRGGS